MNVDFYTNLLMMDRNQLVISISLWKVYQLQEYCLILQRMIP